MIGKTSYFLIYFQYVENFYVLLLVLVLAMKNIKDDKMLVIEIEVFMGYEEVEPHLDLARPDCIYKILHSFVTDTHSIFKK